MLGRNIKYRSNKTANHVGQARYASRAWLRQDVKEGTNENLHRLFRGINVAGNNPLPMKELVAILDGLGVR